jgi:hypothetical protein
VRAGVQVAFLVRDRLIDRLDGRRRSEVHDFFRKLHVLGAIAIDTPLMLALPAFTRSS